MMAWMEWGCCGDDRAKMLMVLGDDDADDEYNVGGLLLPACHCLLPTDGRKTYRVSQKSDFLKLLEPCLCSWSSTQHLDFLVYEEQLQAWIIDHKFWVSLISEMHFFGTPCFRNFSVTTQTVFASPRQIRFEVIGNSRINSVHPHSEIHEKKKCEQKQQEAGPYRYTLRVEGWNNE